MKLENAVESSKRKLAVTKALRSAEESAFAALPNLRKF
jgi:hypothetical protein